MIPCEFMVLELLPTIRKETVKYLLSLNYTQREIAKIMGVSEAAISQYVKNKRGIHKKELEKIVSDCIHKKYDINKTFFENVCQICSYLRESGYFCKSHKLVENVPIEICKGCLTK